MMVSRDWRIVLCRENEKRGVRDEHPWKQHCMETQGKTSWLVNLKSRYA